MKSEWFTRVEKYNEKIKNYKNNGDESLPCMDRYIKGWHVGRFQGHV